MVMWVYGSESDRDGMERDMIAVWKCGGVE